MGISCPCARVANYCEKILRAPEPLQIPWANHPIAGSGVALSGFVRKSAGSCESAQFENLEALRDPGQFFPIFPGIFPKLTCSKLLGEYDPPGVRPRTQTFTPADYFGVVLETTFGATQCSETLLNFVFVFPE